MISTPACQPPVPPHCTPKSEHPPNSQLYTPEELENRRMWQPLPRTEDVPVNEMSWNSTRLQVALMTKVFTPAAPESLLISAASPKILMLDREESVHWLFVRYLPGGKYRAELFVSALHASCIAAWSF